MKKRSFPKELIFWLVTAGLCAAAIAYFYHDYGTPSGSDLLSMLSLCCLCVFVLSGIALFRYVKRKAVAALLLLPALALALPAGYGIHTLLYGPRLGEIRDYVTEKNRMDSLHAADATSVRSAFGKNPQYADETPVIHMPFAVAERFSAKENWVVWDTIGGRLKDYQSVFADFTTPSQCRTLILLQPDPDRRAENKNYRWTSNSDPGVFCPITATVIDMESGKVYRPVDFSRTVLHHHPEKYSSPYLYTNLYRESIQEYQKGNFTAMLKKYTAAQ